jgi:hypothetical protein
MRGNNKSMKLRDSMLMLTFCFKYFLIRMGKKSKNKNVSQKMYKLENEIYIIIFFHTP